MSIELRILSGARAGQSESFDTSVIAIGRDPSSDLRFDVRRDLDVSGKHGEIRAAGGRYTIHDLDSTNGTFVNGVRVPSGGAQELRDRDVISFGAQGPTLAVAIAGAAAHPQQRPTSERVAIAVKAQTRGLRIAVGAVFVVLGGLAASVYWMGARASTARDAEIRALIAANDQSAKTFQARLQGMNDTALTNGLRRSNDSLAGAYRAAKNSQQAAAVQRELTRSHELQRSLGATDLPAVRNANDPALVLIATDVNDTTFQATGFCVNPNGLIVTNRHVVSSDGMKATRIGVKFANTSGWRRAHLVKVDDDPDVDLALIRVDDPGHYPAVTTLATSVDTPVGGAIATLGFPLGTDIPMEGSGNDLVAKTTLTIGTVSKSVTDLLQIDSFASHGSSGSPVFDSHGHVIGVVWGGPPGAAGRIVYAVPAPRITQLVQSVK
jgi:S1-C subfamily serine protease